MFLQAGCLLVIQPRAGLRHGLGLCQRPHCRSLQRSPRLPSWNLGDGRVRRGREGREEGRGFIFAQGPVGDKAGSDPTNNVKAINKNNRLLTGTALKRITTSHKKSVETICK